ncbi:FHA domain-containing protein [Pseudarthrobacter sp. ATCC 49987]|uniref:FHA domain-containing protein n=1 Tax=Pseudarthrobacter sp. ATCC 49987 TaxID=2698204 RepID=UPI0013719F53|nr:FHA domain-containing protein [Pseudarthrobacter sp. ATCC 49987]
MSGSNPAAAARYTPGSWLGVVRSGTVVLLRPDSSPALVQSLWELLATVPEAHEVLDAVSSASGGSLARLPWFAIVANRGSVQAFLRGGIDLTVDLPSGPVDLNGRDVTTWTERRFAAADGFSLTVPGAEAAGAPGAALDLPLADGVVLLQGLRVDLTGAAAREPSLSLPAAAVPAVAVRAAAEEVAAPDDDILAAAEADIAAEAGNAAELSEHGASSATVLEFPGEDLELDGTLHEEPEPLTEPEPEPEEEPEPEPEPEPELAGHEPEPSGPQEPAAPETADQEPTGTYDHLWEQTVMRNIEDAAVREDPDADAEPAAGSASADPAPETAPDPEPVAALEAAEPEAAPAPAPPAAPRPPSTGLIDSVPWHTGGDRASSTASRTPGWPAPPTAPSPLPAAPLPPSAPQAGVPQRVQLSAALPETDADHDGQTIMKGDLAGPGALPDGAARPSTGPAAAPATGPMVLARVCPQGHANPSTYAQCGRCAQPLPGEGVQVRRPRLGRMRLSSGELVDLDQSLIVGRQPSVSRVQGGVMPRLVQVASPSGDISRSHVEVRLEGWHVMLCDLKATNGTVLIREGQPPRRLAQGEMAILLDGDIAEVGDGISLRFEEIP